jgi:GTPase SAR1 family protein
LTNSTFPGFKVALIGPSGTGKTFSLRSLVQAWEGIGDVFYLDLDRSLETIIGGFVDPPPRGLGLKEPPPHFHWHYMHRKTQGFSALREASENVSKYDLSTLAKMKDNSRSTNNQFTQFLDICNGFVDQRDGKNYGAVDSWSNDRIFIVDSLTALNKVVFDMVVGTRPMRDKPDYGIAQNILSNWLDRATLGCICNFVLIGHVERQVDEVLGGVKLVPVTIGKAMTPEVPIPFSDVILTARNGTEWSWDTANGQADLKTRNLDYKSKLPPDFGPLIKTWKQRRDAAQGGGGTSVQ